MHGQPNNYGCKKDGERTILFVLIILELSDDLLFIEGVGTEKKWVG